MTTTQAFVDGLNETFTQRLHKGLSAESLSGRVCAWRLLVRGESGAALQDLNQALRDAAVSRHLATWTTGDLFVFVQGPHWCAPVPAALVRGGALLLTSGSVTATRAYASNVASFAQWFEELIGDPLPFECDLYRLGWDLWGSAEARGGNVRGFPHRLFIEDRARFTLASYARYGRDTYALNYTRVSGPTRMYLRLPYYASTLVADLREADRLFELAAGKQLPMYLNQNMGEWYFADSPDPSQAQWASLDIVRGYVEEAPG